MMVDMAKGNITNVLPMILIGGWINWHYSGFITSKVAFMYIRTLRTRKLFIAHKNQRFWCGVHKVSDQLLGHHGSKQLNNSLFGNMSAKGWHPFVSGQYHVPLTCWPALPDFKP